MEGRVRRKDFETLLERARAGVTQGIAVWHVDRLFRQPRDLERLIDLADHGFRVISSHGSRDLSDPDDRYILRIEVAHAARSSDDTSRRIRRRHQRFREEGRPVGGPPGFGFPRLDRCDPSSADGEPGSEPGGEPGGLGDSDGGGRSRAVVPVERVAAWLAYRAARGRADDVGVAFGGRAQGGAAVGDGKDVVAAGVRLMRSARSNCRSSSTTRTRLIPSARSARCPGSHSTFKLICGGVNASLCSICGVGRRAGEALAE